MRFLIFIFLLTNLPTVFALELNDEMKVKIMDVYRGNIIILSRGREDSIERGDHIKLTNPNGFIGRGICLKAGMTLSHWKIYRVVRPELVSRDPVYDLKSLNQSEVAPRYLSYQLFNLEEFLKKNEVQEKSVAKKDIPESVEQVIKVSTKASFDEYQKNEVAKSKVVFNQQNQKNFNFALQAYPVSRTKNAGFEESIAFGAGIKTANPEDKAFSASYFQQKERRVGVDGQEVESSLKQARASYTVYNFYKNLDYLAYTEYYQEMNGGRYFPRSTVRVGPVGVSYRAQNTDDLKVTLGYIPLWEVRKDDIHPSLVGVDEVAEQKSDEAYIRHALFMQLSAKLSESWKVENQFWLRPYQGALGFEFDTNDNDMFNEFRLEYMANQYLGISYYNRFHRDTRRELTALVPATNMTHLLSFNFYFDL